MRQENVLELFRIMQGHVRLIDLEFRAHQCRRLRREKEKSKLYS